jgi:two-component system NarL family response regulator
MEILALIARGRSNKAIARELDISEGTVKTHVKSILQKLDATSRTEAVSIGAKRGLVRL